MKPDASRTVYDGKLVDVVLERWGDRDVEIVEHPGSVAVVAVDAEGCVTLVRQRREPARAELLELPAGTLEPGEDPLACARRELAEETGLHGGDWRQALSFWTTPGFCRELMHLYFAEGVVRGEQRTEPDEAIELVRWPVVEIVARLGEVQDAKTVAGLLFYVANPGNAGEPSGHP
jgi:ADP-ribose pyrophosphatase